jgi:hypothetical protein
MFDAITKMPRPSKPPVSDLNIGNSFRQTNAGRVGWSLAPHFTLHSKADFLWRCTLHTVEDVAAAARFMVVACEEKQGKVAHARDVACLAGAQSEESMCACRRATDGPVAAHFNAEKHVLHSIGRWSQTNGTVRAGSLAIRGRFRDRHFLKGLEMQAAKLLAGMFLCAALAGCGNENEKKSSVDVKVNGKSAVKVDTTRTTNDDDRDKKTNVDVDVKTSKNP